jgi:hypothetical protein
MPVTDIVGVDPFNEPGKVKAWGTPELLSAWDLKAGVLSRLQIPNSTPASAAYCSLNVSPALPDPRERALTKDRKGVNNIEPTASVIKAAGSDLPGLLPRIRHLSRFNLKESRGFLHLLAISVNTCPKYLDSFINSN